MGQYTRALGQKSCYQLKDLVTANRYVKYQSPIPLGSKDIAKVEVFKQRSNFKVTRSNALVPNERSGHNESIYEISKPSPLVGNI